MKPLAFRSDDKLPRKYIIIYIIIIEVSVVVEIYVENSKKLL